MFDRRGISRTLTHVTAHWLSSRPAHCRIAAARTPISTSAQEQDQQLSDTLAPCRCADNVGCRGRAALSGETSV